MTIEEITKILNEFSPFKEDDPINDNQTFLYSLMDAWEKTPNRLKAIPAIFNLMEKYPHADFGSPGPLVHALEVLGIEQYEGELQMSFAQKTHSSNSMDV